MVSERPAKLTYQQAAEWLAEVRFSDPFDPEPFFEYVQQNPNWLEQFSPEERAKLSIVINDISSKSLDS